jgi:hypothetical protein
MQSNIVKQTKEPVTNIIPVVTVMTGMRIFYIYFLPFSLN